MIKKYLPIFLFIISIILLVPGVTQPLLTIKATVNKQKMFDMAANSFVDQMQGNNFVQNMLQSVLKQITVEGSTEVFESTRSLLETMNQLISNNHLLVGLLIGVFGVIIPLLKILLTIVAFFVNLEKNKLVLMKVSSLLSKWSMSDVFVMAILVAFFTVNANEQAVSSVQMYAELGAGFYYFSGYCLFAIAAGQLLQFKNKSD